MENLIILFGATLEKIGDFTLSAGSFFMWHEADYPYELFERE